MLIIGDVLTAAEAARVREGLAGAPFGEGRRTAKGAAKAVKSNRQADGTDEGVQALARFVLRALERNGLFQLYARPARHSPVLFNRYGPGEAYGLHMDEPVMGAGEGRLRTDLSFTLFLSDPETYEGGELIVDGVDGEREVKLPAGALAVYSTGDLHRVAAVTAGERLAAVGWVQSLVRRADERAVLFDLGRLRGSLCEGDNALLLDKTIGNLIRLWAEP
ncbi:MAG: Fe2+-dependent dioxygenase [Caulobacteraceae bacterium]